MSSEARREPATRGRIRKLARQQEDLLFGARDSGAGAFRTRPTPLARLLEKGWSR
jgi:hypothetical protein